MHRIEDVLHRLALGYLAIPEGVDPGDFIGGGGTSTEKSAAHSKTRAISFLAAAEEYTYNLGHLAPSHRGTVQTHLNNLRKKLAGKADGPLARIERRDLEHFLQGRLKERSPTTVAKERVSVQQFFDWTVRLGYLRSSPAADLTRIKGAGDCHPTSSFAAQSRHQFCRPIWTAGLPRTVVQSSITLLSRTRLSAG